MRGPQSFLEGTTSAGFRGSVLDAFGIRTLDPARGEVELVDR